MCTVTFLPINNRVYITHNRDERLNRPQSLPPAVFHKNGFRLLFPKDTQAGGSWIGTNENGNAAFLLNGAFTNHNPEPSYSKSRGIVFLDILATDNMLTAFKTTHFAGIEPFTIILWNGNQLHDCRWDGHHHHTSEIPADQPHIWSSCTLYDNEIMEKREEWFKKWFNENAFPSMDDVINFHLYTGEGDSSYDICMNRQSFKTISITCIEINGETAKMNYTDLLDNSVYEQELSFQKTQVEN